MASMELLGVEGVVQSLKHVSPREGKNIARRTITRVAAKVRDDIRSRAPKGDGTLRKAIKSRRRRGQRGMIEAAVFIEHGPQAKNDAFYWFFLEFGTRFMDYRPFIYPAVEEWESRVTGEWARQWWPQFSKEMAKRAKKQAKGVRR